MQRLTNGQTDGCDQMDYLPAMQLTIMTSNCLQVIDLCFCTFHHVTAAVRESITSRVSLTPARFKSSYCLVHTTDNPHTLKNVKGALLLRWHSSRLKATTGGPVCYFDIVHVSLIIQQPS